MERAREGSRDSFARLTARVREMHAAGLTDREMAEQLGITCVAVTQRRLRTLGLPPNVARNRLSPSEADARIREMHAEGLSDRRIGEQLGVSETQVRGWRHELGLPALHRGRQVLPARREEVKAK